MNASERKKLKRAMDSLAVWKRKAMTRNIRIRHMDRKVRELIESRTEWKKKNERLKEIIGSLEMEIKMLKK